PEPAAPARPALRPKWRWLVAAGVLTCLMAAGGTAFFLWPRSVPPPSLVSSRRMLPLFNGVNVNPPDWVLRQGVWAPARDAEGGAMRTGAGTVQRRLPAWTNYRISMGVDLQRATAVELQFGLGATEADPPRLVLRASAQGVVLGKRNGET